MGTVRHPGQRDRPRLRPNRDGPVDRPEFKRYWIDDTPQHRAAAPEEIGPLVVFLASAAASFITGSVIVADGGYTLW
jgi:NAD(P)-dependent dehydrogenase (short-subunit alcohol dehydrogenase family)